MIATRDNGMKKYTMIGNGLWLGDDGKYYFLTQPGPGRLEYEGPFDTAAEAATAKISPEIFGEVVIK